MALVKNMLFLHLLLLLLKVDSKCPESFDCGPYRTLEFPLSNDPNCGLFVIKDCGSPSPTIDIRGGEYRYSFMNHPSANQLTLFDHRLENNLIGGNCLSFENLTLPRSPSFSFTLITPNLTLFKCLNKDLDEDTNDPFYGYKKAECRSDWMSPSTVYYKYPSTGISSVPSTCSVSQLPVNTGRSSDDLFKLISPEFTLEWAVSEACLKCHREGGQCMDKGSELHCKKGNIRSRKIFLLIGGVAALMSISIVGVFLTTRRKYTLSEFLTYRKNSANDKDFEVFMKTNGNLAPRRYKYSQIKKMTNSFTVNLGKGGYGSVYRGNLPDGRPVAVKILEESKGSGDEFMNEVASISRTSHINIVTLLGFCFEGSKRALIYEFMPNGSLEKFIQNTASSSEEEEVCLGWRVLLEIALGIARGLEYLHHSCNMRILHFDIKPHNILLDKDFNPRISDFGLARLCPNRSSIVSMLVARGTIGYIAPEVFCRNFGEVSHKSDVYSYGMMVLEIAGGKKTINPKDDLSSDMYFPHYIYKQLEADVKEDGNLDEITHEDERQSAERKLIIVSLWCIQTDPKDRPSMTKVVEMLEGELEALQVPPKPYLSSPPRAAPEISTSRSEYHQAWI